MKPSLRAVWLVLATLLLITQTVTAQTLDFVRSAGGTSGGTNTGRATATDADGNVYMTGNFTGTIDFDATTLRSAGGTDFFVAKYNASGTVLWARRGGGTGDDSGNGVTVATVNGIVSVYVTGNFEGTANFAPNSTSTLTSAGSNDVFLVKYDRDGAMQWVHRGGGSSGDEGSGVAVGPDGGVYVTGNFQGTANFTSFTTANPASNTLSSAGHSYDMFVAKYNPSGVLEWLQRGGGTGFDAGRGVAVAPTPDGSVYVTGFFRNTADFTSFTTANPASNTLSSAGVYDVFLVKYDASGVLQWVQRGGGTGDDYGNGVAVAPDGSVYVTGIFRGTADFNTPTDPASTTTLTSAGADELFVAKYEASGAVQWLRRGGGAGDESGQGVAVAPDESVYVTGIFEQTANFNTPSDPTSNTLITAGADDLFVIKYNALGDVRWVRRGGGTGTDASLGVAVAPASGNSHRVYITGSFQSTADFNTPTSLTDNTLTSAGDSDVFLARYNADGTPQLQRQVGGSGVAAEGRATATDANGNVYVTGYFTGVARFGSTSLTSAGETDLFVAKYDASGAVQWVRRGGGSGDDAGRGVAVGADGSVYVTGNFQGTANFNTPTSPAGNTLSSAGNSYDVFVAKYNPSGGVEWLRRGGGSGGDYGEGVAVATAQDGSVSVYVTGYFAGAANFNTPTDPNNNRITSAGNFDVFLAKYNAAGTVQWLRRGGGHGDDRGAGVAVGPDGGVYVTGRFVDTVIFDIPATPGSNTFTWGEDRDMFLVRYNASGAVQWIRGGNGVDFGEGVAVAPDGSVYVTGYFENPADFIISAGAFDMFLDKYNASGRLVWRRRGGGSGSNDVGEDVAVDADGSVYVTGSFASIADFNTPTSSARNTLTSVGNTDGFVIKYDASGTVRWVRRWGGTGEDVGYGVSVSPNRSVYVTGFFGGTADFNTPTNSATNTITSRGDYDMFVAKFQGGTIPPSVTFVTAGTIAPNSCSVSARLTVTGNSFKIVGPGRYSFINSFTTLVTNYILVVNSMTTPGTYTVVAYNSSGQSVISYYTVNGTACILAASPSPSSARLDDRTARKATGLLSLTLTPSSLTYTTGQIVTVRVEGGTSGTDYSILLYDSDPFPNNLTNYLSYSTSQGLGNTITWGANATEEFYVVFLPGSEGIDRILTVADPTLTELVNSSPFAIQEPCTNLPDVTIVFPNSASVSSGPVITVPVGQGLSYQVLGGGPNAHYERRIIIDRINGYEIRAVSDNTTGIFPIDRPGLYSIIVTDANGCSRTVKGEVRGQ